jgi:hypothetical protein
VVRVAPDGRLYAAPSRMPRSHRYAEPEPAAQAATADGSGSRRPARGIRGRRALTDDDVREIRADYAEGRWTMVDLAYIHDVSQPTIFAAIHGYRHVVGEG